MIYTRNNTQSLSAIIKAIFIILVLFIVALPNNAFAEIKSKSDNGFAILYIGDVKAQPDEIWNRLLEPSKWWSSKHSYTGKSINFYLEPRVNGCFCETLISDDEDGNEINTGEVEHLRIIHIDKYRVLRMTGALGPLQSEAVNGTLTIAMQANDDGTTKMSFSYVVGGYMRYKVDQIAGPVDRVIGEQFKNLTQQWGLKEAVSIGAKNSKISISEDTKLIDFGDTELPSESTNFQEDDSDIIDDELSDEPAASEEVRKER